MKVDFDNLRRQTAITYNNLIKSFKSENWTACIIEKDLDDSQKKLLDQLRMNIGFICSCEDSDDPEDFNLVDEDMETIFNDKDFD